VFLRLPTFAFIATTIANDVPNGLFVLLSPTFANDDRLGLRDLLAPFAACLARRSSATSPAASLVAA
jgi:hypothetical protein